ncbi:hypothetical protein Chor_014466 [Crotalus horridus]
MLPQKRTVICDPVLCQPLNCSEPVHQSNQCCPVCQEGNEEQRRAEKIRASSEASEKTSSLLSDMMQADGPRACKFGRQWYMHNESWHPIVPPFGEMKCITCWCLVSMEASVTTGVGNFTANFSG